MIDPLVEALGWTLVHFLWQGAVIGALFALLLALVRRGPQARYLAGCVALLAMVGAAAGTFTFEYQAAAQRHYAEAPAKTDSEPVAPAVLVFDRCRPCHSVQLDGAPAPPLAPPEPGHSRRVAAFPEGFPISSSLTPFDTSESCLGVPAKSDDEAEVAAVATPNDPGTQAGPPTLSWLAKLWLTGVVLLSLRLAVSWGCAQRLQNRAVLPSDPPLLQCLRRLARQIGVSRPLRLVRSAAVAVPTVVGWIRPLILLPTASVAGLSRSQLEAVLAHELAHIRRHDYLVNLLQHLLETVLFFHPAVWWVSGKLREEREHCCDDIAAQTIGDAIDYARALATLEEQRGEQLAIGMAANGGSLLARIRRLCGVERQPGFPMIALPALVLLTAVIVPLSLVDAQPPATPTAEASTLPKPAAPRALTPEEGLKGLRHMLAKEPEAGIAFDDFVLLARALDEKSIVILLDEIGMRLTGGYQAWTRSAVYAEWARRDLNASLDYFRRNYENYRGVREQIPHALYVGSRPEDPWKALEYLRSLPDDPRFRLTIEVNRRNARMIYRNADWYKESHKRLFEGLATLDPERAWKQLPGSGEPDEKPRSQNNLLNSGVPYESMVEGFFAGLKDRETVVRFVERFGPVGEPGTEPIAIVIAKAWMRFDLVAAHEWAPPQLPINPLGAATLIWGVEGNAVRSWARDNPEAALQAIREDTLPQWTSLMAESLLEGNPLLAGELVAVLGKAYKPWPMPDIIMQWNPDNPPIEVNPAVTVPPRDGYVPTAWHAIRNSIRENVGVEDPDAFPEPGRQIRTPDFRARYDSYRKAIASEAFTRKQQTELMTVLEAAFKKILKTDHHN